MSTASTEDNNRGGPEKRQACPSSAPARGSATFGGKHADQYEAMKRALHDAAVWHGVPRSEYMIYAYLEEVPKTSLVVELVDALHRGGYRITRSQNDQDQVRSREPRTATGKLKWIT